MWKETIVTYFEVLSQHLPNRSEENHGNPESKGCTNLQSLKCINIHFCHKLEEKNFSYTIYFDPSGFLLFRKPSKLKNVVIPYYLNLKVY
jgi:hypothetical protein